MLQPSKGQSHGIGDGGERYRSEACDRLMLIDSDRVFYAGLIGTPSARTLGSLTVYLSLAAPIRVRVAGGDWQTGDLAVVPPFQSHELACASRLIGCIMLEPEFLDREVLDNFLCSADGAKVHSEIASRARDVYAHLRRHPGSPPPLGDEFDKAFFPARLEPRSIDRRIEKVVRFINSDPGRSIGAQECAALVNLSFSRFLHLFRDEVGVPFRAFRAWKRARALLHHVNKNENLARVALDVGYPDSTCFSHSIRYVYGLTPRDIFAGSRRLAIYDGTRPPDRK